MGCTVTWDISIPRPICESTMEKTAHRQAAAISPLMAREHQKKKTATNKMTQEKLRCTR